MSTMKRRSFLKTTATVAAASTLPTIVKAEDAPVATIVVVHGKDIPKMLAAGIAKMGGWDKFVKTGAKVTLKPNIAWNSKPEEGGNTHPDLIRACVLSIEEKGAKVTIPENTCHDEKSTFKTSGVEEALKGTKARLYRPAANDYQKVDVPKGQICKSAEVPKDVLSCDCLINMPVAKNHGGATLTLSMKNWMGSVSNESRRAWHRDGLHQCIADFSTFLKPQLVIIDATRIMLTKGPQGPGEMAHPEEIIFSTDPVAADAYAATLFKKAPFDIGHIKIAHDMGVGCGDLSKVKVERIEV